MAPDLAPRDALELHGRLDDAFAALAASGGQPVPVLGEDRRPLGLLSMTGLLGALRRITAEAERDAA